MSEVRLALGRNGRKPLTGAESLAHCARFRRKGVLDRGKGKGTRPEV